MEEIPMKNFDTLIKLVEKHPISKVAVAVAEDTSVIEAVRDAHDGSIADAILVGNERNIREKAESSGISLDGHTIVNVEDPIEAVAKAVQLVSSGEADILMKGYVHTDDFLRGVLNKEWGLRSGSIMSHVFIAEIAERDKLIFITDGAMNIAPDLQAKAAILLNAVHLANIFGVMKPKVAVLGAVEVVNPAMQATLDAGSMAKMADRRQYVPECIIDGPLALDNAVDPDAARHKRIAGPVAGNADVLLVPNIEAGNMLAKSLVFLGTHRMIGLLVGAKAPVVLTSRADGREAKLLSIAGAVLMVNIKRALELKLGEVHY
jgi:phosphate butyryltransferase